MYIERPGYSDDKTVIVRCCSQLEVVRLENPRSDYDWLFHEIL